MSIGAKSSLGKMSGVAGIVRKADKEKDSNTKNAEKKITAKTKVTQTKNA